MNIAIVYKSVTGNTKIIADKIKEKLGDNVKYFGEPKEGIEAELYFVGSWTDKGMCCKEIENFMKSLENKQIIYFGTAGFGESKEYYEMLFNRIKEIIPESNKIISYFFCQGKMPIAVKERYEKMIKENPSDKKIKLILENFDKALEHPNEEDFKELSNWSDNLNILN